MFLIKKIIGPLLTPLSFCLLVLLLGLFFLGSMRRQKIGKFFVTLGTVLLCLLSYDAIANLLIRPLERQYPVISNFEPLQDIQWIVVLGGGCHVDPDLPVSTYLTSASLIRLAEGIRIYNHIPDAKLIVTGGSGFSGFTPVAKIMAQMARQLGIAQDRIVVESESADTKDHPVFVKNIIGQSRFILVTSASHMPRAMALFTKAGLHPVAGPTDFMAMKSQGISPGAFFPGAVSLQNAGRAIHEYLGLVWGRMVSQL